MSDMNNRQTEDDERLHKKVWDALFRDRMFHGKDINVFVENGIVTLRGEVSDRKMKRYAQDCLDHVYGVLEVKNLLMVRPDSGLVGDMNWPI